VKVHAITTLPRESSHLIQNIWNIRKLNLTGLAGIFDTTDLLKGLGAPSSGKFTETGREGVAEVRVVMEVRGAGVWVGINTVMSHSATLRFSFYQICDRHSWVVPRVSGPTHAIEN
jgi:hypothetical protein